MWSPSGDYACDWKGAIQDTHQYTTTHWVFILITTLLFLETVPVLVHVCFLCPQNKSPCSF